MYNSFRQIYLGISHTSWACFCWEQLLELQKKIPLGIFLWLYLHKLPGVSCELGSHRNLCNKQINNSSCKARFFPPNVYAVIVCYLLMLFTTQIGQPYFNTNQVHWARIGLESGDCLVWCPMKGGVFFVFTGCCELLKIIK